MTQLIRHAGETQRQFVERILRTEGRIATYEVLYDARWEDGRKTSITRLAAIIHTLRGEGWQVVTQGTGGVAVYVLLTFRPVVSVPAWRAWTCTACGGRPSSVPEPVLGGMAAGRCESCKGRRTFRRDEAA
jgi:hypothetical protein